MFTDDMIICCTRSAFLVIFDDYSLKFTDIKVSVVWVGSGQIGFMNTETEAFLTGRKD
jgi:hypothetical protein